MPASSPAVGQLQRKVWAGSLPLEVRLASGDCRTFDQSDAYLINVPRLSYLAFLLPRLHAFFASSAIDPTIPAEHAWLSFEGVPLKWHYPVGLLYDLHAGAQPASWDDSADTRLPPMTSAGAEDESAAADERAKEEDVLPWRLTLHYTDFPHEQLIQLDKESRVLLDTFINCVKEADHIRNGNAKVFMGMSKDNTNALWHSVKTHDLKLFNSINNRLLDPPGIALRNIPIKIYLPNAPATLEEDIPETSKQGSIRVVQNLVPPFSADRKPTTLGEALKATIPTVFPSRLNPLLASPVAHGAILPMRARLEDLLRAASHADGFLHITVVMLG